jgi:hypothetical protein
MLGLLTALALAAVVLQLQPTLLGLAPALGLVHSKDVSVVFYFELSTAPRHCREIVFELMIAMFCDHQNRWKTAF